MKRLTPRKPLIVVRETLRPISAQQAVTVQGGSGIDAPHMGIVEGGTAR